MRPGARVQAAIEVLALILSGAPAERELTAWARASRYAGSGDRAAVRDLVYDALRRLRSAAWIGGCGDVPPEAMDARAVMAGLLRGLGQDVDALFDGGRHSPAPIALPADPGPMPKGVALDIPDWLLARPDNGSIVRQTAAASRDRAPIYLRANLALASRDDLLRMLAEAGHRAEADPTSESAIRLDGPARGLTGLPAWHDGLFELQDAGAQALVERLPVEPGARILDLCAGGGGKTLAMAARAGARFYAYDVDARRMRDLPVRAARAGVVIETIERPETHAPFDGVLADVPCSGSGTWRRAPEAKWRLTPARLDELRELQDTILRQASDLVGPGGWLAYATCSVLPEENGDRVQAALNPTVWVRAGGWERIPSEDGPDGFHMTVLRRSG